MKKGSVCFLIDDDFDDQEIFSLALEKVDSSFTFISANSGSEALQMLGNRQLSVPDFIFLDLNMPRMNGKECLKEIKKFEHLKDIPVVIYSTSSMRNDIAETSSLGAADFITKPFNMVDLVDALTRFFDKKSKTNRITIVKDKTSSNDKEV
jgi:CheY-like chemotaxis protein